MRTKRRGSPHRNSEDGRSCADGVAHFHAIAAMADCHGRVPKHTSASSLESPTCSGSGRKRSFALRFTTCAGQSRAKGLLRCSTRKSPVERNWRRTEHRTALKECGLPPSGMPELHDERECTAKRWKRDVAAATLSGTGRQERSIGARRPASRPCPALPVPAPAPARSPSLADPSAAPECPDEKCSQLRHLAAPNRCTAKDVAARDPSSRGRHRPRLRRTELRLPT